VLEGEESEKRQERGMKGKNVFRKMEMKGLIVIVILLSLFSYITLPNQFS